jgi:major vault protein
VDEVVVSSVNGYILEKNKTALMLRAKRTFTDEFGKERKAGEEWLVTYEDHGMEPISTF